MRTLINRIRQAFCKHEFIYEEGYKVNKIEGEVVRKGMKVLRTCKKCGWHKSYWKF